MSEIEMTEEQIRARIAMIDSWFNGCHPIPAEPSAFQIEHTHMTEERRRLVAMLQSKLDAQAGEARTAEREGGSTPSAI